MVIDRDLFLATVDMELASAGSVLTRTEIPIRITVVLIRWYYGDNLLNP